MIWQKSSGRISKQTHSLLMKNGNSDVAETLQAIRFGKQVQTEFCGLKSEFTFREAAAYKKKSCAHIIIIQQRAIKALAEPLNALC
jgi:hypothetical protein